MGQTASLLHMVSSREGHIIIVLCVVLDRINTTSTIKMLGRC